VNHPAASVWWEWLGTIATGSPASQMDDRKLIAEKIRHLTGWTNVDRFEIHSDTTDWLRIKRGDIMRLGQCDYLVKGNMHETRFGIGEQPKYWVFSVLELETGEHKIIKTVFLEDFYVHVGIFKIHCYRSSEKEAYVLDIAKGDDRFMQGYTVMDSKENRIRVIDFIRGKTVFSYVHGIEKDHEQYFHEDLPDILRNLTDCFEAIDFLHKHGTCHGDVRNDHIIIDADTGKYRWIDFDLNQHVSDYDVWSLGNIINYAVGKGINSFQQILKGDKFSKDVKESLRPEDASAFFEYRVMNLKKLYPYIPPKLDNILNHFTIKPKAYYSNCSRLIEDYVEMLETEFP
jgi:serine/threonine protein kinase